LYPSLYAFYGYSEALIVGGVTILVEEVLDEVDGVSREDILGGFAWFDCCEHYLL
jgi:hypothetical protein